MNAPDKFIFKPAVREQTPLLLGLVGPSGSGKTYSALRLATGIQSVAGGDIAVIDTEARRALHYAGTFSFRHLDFAPPHGPDRYLQAIQAAVAMGAKTIVVDSMSHEHEGAGGVLEWHEAELDRIAGDDWKKREAVNLLGWAKPKGARRKLINGLLQLHANFIFCFRAKEKVKPVKNAQGKTEIVSQGWQAIAGEEFVYEMTDRFLLLPGSEGVPAWDKDAMDTGVPKLPGDHRGILAEGAQLNEQIGAALARWAMGDQPGALPASLIATFAGVGVSLDHIRAHLGREPVAQDVKALKAWGRDLASGKAKVPELKPVGQTVDRSTSQIDQADQSHGGAPVVTYAKLADRLHKAADRDVAELVLDEGRGLPSDQQRDLRKIFDERWPAE
jgi:energy-coupling factor transporter ATP-binding protein EcfA2